MEKLERNAVRLQETLASIQDEVLLSVKVSLYLCDRFHDKVW